MTLDASKLGFTSELGSFQNSDIVSQSFDIAAYTFSSGNAQVITETIPLDNNEDTSQVQVNLSFDSAKWYLVPMVRAFVIQPSASTYAQVYSNYDGSNLIITLVIIPVGSSPWSYSAFTLNVKAKLFITPS